MADADDLVVEIETLGIKLGQARSSIASRFLGQDKVVDLTLTALICGGHAVLVGLPGLGKTRLVDTLSTDRWQERRPQTAKAHAEPMPKRQRKAKMSRATRLSP